MVRLKSRAAKVAVAAAIGAVAMVPAGTATAKIKPASCETSTGQTPPGQQPTCTGAGLQQEPATNPAGQAPPGQQP